MEFKDYVEATLTLMEDTDWSRHLNLQDASSGDLKAAAVAVWHSGTQTPDADAMVTMLSRRYAYFSDDSALANGEDDTRRFMDQADDLKLPSSVLDRLNTEVARKLVERYKGRGWHVVDLRSGLPDNEVKPDEEGIYVFTSPSASHQLH